MDTPYLTAEEMAAILKISPITVRRWADEEKIPAIKFPPDDAEKADGRTKWRFDKALVVQHLSTGFTDPWARKGSQGVTRGRSA